MATKETESAPPRIVTSPRTLALSDLKPYERIDILFRSGTLVGNVIYLGMRLTEGGQRPCYEHQGHEECINWPEIIGFRSV
jgi:hypothetical protein